MSIPPVTAARLADAILVLHTGIVAFVLAGTMLIVVGAWRGWAWVHGFAWRLAHVVLMVFIAVQAWRGALCPLTVWEQALRTRAGQPVYTESFVAHWLARVLFYDAPWWAFVVAYTAFALLVVGLWVFVPPRRARRHLHSRHAR
jgi:hypothetical protein